MANIEVDLIKIRENGIYLMLPAYGGQCFAAFSRSLMQLSALCANYQIPFDTFFIYNESLVQRARNYCADAFLRAKFRIERDGKVEERYFQHGIFVDSDIEFNPIDIIVMAHLQNTNEDYNVVCGAYPKKIIAYEKIKRAVEKGFADNDPNDLEKYIGDFVFNAESSGPIHLNKPFEVKEAGTGFMMFRRDTLLRLNEKYPDIKYRPDHSRSDHFDGSNEVSAFFHCIVDPESKRYLSEDYYFCKIVREAGMKVWMVPWFELKHHGYFIYSGSLGAMAQAGVAATVDEKELKKVKKRK